MPNLTTWLIRSYSVIINDIFCSKIRHPCVSFQTNPSREGFWKLLLGQKRCILLCSWQGRKYGSMFFHRYCQRYEYFKRWPKKMKQTRAMIMGIDNEVIVSFLLLFFSKTMPTPHTCKWRLLPMQAWYGSPLWRSVYVWLLQWVSTCWKFSTGVHVHGCMESFPSFLSK